MFKKIGCIMTIGLVFFVVIFSIIRKPKEIVATLVPESIQIVSELGEADRIVIDIYINQKHSFLSNINQISQTYITDKNNLNVLPATIIAIDLMDSVIIGKNNFYQYQYTLDINYQSTMSFSLQEAYLLVHFFHNNNVNFHIGSMYIHKTISFSTTHLSLHQIKGIVNEVNGQLTLVGIALGIKATRSDIKIHSITTLDATSFAQRLIKIEGIDFPSHKAIHEVINASYNIYDEAMMGRTPLQQGENYYVLTIGYYNHYPIETLGLHIMYESNGETKAYYLFPFTFFLNHKRIMSIYDLVMYTYDHH